MSKTFNASSQEDYAKKTNTKFTSYQDLLKILKLDSLEIRGVKFDLILMYKIFHNIVDLDFDEYFSNNSINQKYNLRGHNYKIKLEKYSGSTVRNNFFVIELKHFGTNYQTI